MRSWARTMSARIAAALLRGSVTGWRYLCTLYAVMRLGLLWRRFCASTGLAEQRHRTNRETGKTKTTIRRVPKLERVRVTPHGWTMRVKLRPGQHLDLYTERTAPLRHFARAQAVKPAELWHQPGFLEIAVLRRDPLRRVLVRPREVDPGQLVIGTTETGGPFLLDFNTEPHWLVSGATDSGKSSLLAACLCALAPTRDLLVSWDLKFGIEGEAFRARFSDVTTTAAGVRDWCTRLLTLAAARAELFKTWQVANIAEAETQHGIHLRRVYVFCDEVAELATSHDGIKPEELLGEVLRVVQLCRAMGIHLIVAGQRFGSDLGKLVTAIRAQLGGRICLRVNDEETARMVLAGLDPEVHARALCLPHKGMAIVKHRGDWHYARASYQPSPERYAIAACHADKRITWEALLVEDANLAATTPPLAPAA